MSFDCPRGPKDIITNEEDGYLIEDGDIKSFADRLSFMIEDENRRKVMGKKARENAKRYLPDNVVPLWDTLFKSLIRN